MKETAISIGAASTKATEACIPSGKRLFEDNYSIQLSELKGQGRTRKF